MTEELGFFDSESKYIYVGSTQPNSPWYFWNKETEQPIPITKSNLKCHITGIEVVLKEYKSEIKPKLQLHINANENYVIQTGLNTWFAKTLLVRLVAMDQVMLSSRVSIQAQIGEDAKIVFVSVCNAHKEWVKKTENIDYKDLDEVALYELVEKIQSRLKTAEPSPPPESDTPF
jgi:hypothetical protein